MKWACGWMKAHNRCCRLDCRKSAPCEGFEDGRRDGDGPGMGTRCPMCHVTNGHLSDCENNERDRL